MHQGERGKCARSMLPTSPIKQSSDCTPRTSPARRHAPRRAKSRLKRRLPRRGCRRRQPTEGAELNGVLQEERELVIAHVEHLFDERCPEHLLGGQSFTTLLHAPTARKILADRR